MCVCPCVYVCVDLTDLFKFICVYLSLVLLCLPICNYNKPWSLAVFFLLTLLVFFNICSYYLSFYVNWRVHFPTKIMLVFYYNHIKSIHQFRKNKSLLCCFPINKYCMIYDLFLSFIYWIFDCVSLFLQWLFNGYSILIYLFTSLSELIFNYFKWNIEVLLLYRFLL